MKRISKGASAAEEAAERTPKAQPQPFRFPAFEVIEIRPDIAPNYALDRLWLRVNAPNFNKTVDLKVSISL